ncbi:MAG: tetratricopeptide repeat protein [Phycisphaerales bacterium]|nr:tetratricopeptide repeat protein [Phycisphaerales bacterium]
MASKVNVKFVAILVGVLILLAGGVGGAAMFVLFKSAKDLASQGDALMKANNPTEAEKAYAKAVNKEPTNAEYLRKWRDSLSQVVPKSQTLFDSKYPQYTVVRKRLADLLRTDVAAHRDHLDTLIEMLGAGYNRQLCEQIAQTTTDALAQFGETKQGGESDVLKRYRAMANLRIMTEARNLKPEVEQQIKSDFEAALAADPGDVESVIGLQTWHLYQADMAIRGERLDEGNKLAEQGRKIVRDFRAKAPNEPKAMLAQIGWLLTDARRQAQAMSNPADRKKLADQLRDDARKGLDEADKVFAAADPKELEAATLTQFTFLELNLDDSGKLTRSRAAIDRAVQAQPGNAAVLMARAEAETLARDFDAAIATLQVVRDLPNPPLNVQGKLLWFRKNEALFRQAAICMRAWEYAGDPDEAKLKQVRAGWLEKAKSRRGELAKVEPEGSTRLLFVDGKIKLAEEDYLNAQRLLLSYLANVGDQDADALFAAAKASAQLNQPGKARELLEKALAINPGNVTAIMLLAEVEIRLRNVPRAKELYKMASEMIPGNEAIQRRLLAIEQELGEKAVTDPVAKVVAEARAKQLAGDEKGAADTLEAGMVASNYAQELTMRVVNLKMSRNDIDTATSILEKAIAAAKDRPSEAEVFQKALSVLKAGDPTKARLVALEQAKDIPPAQRALQKAAILDAGGEVYKAQAQEAFADLAKNFPEDSMVIETLFIKALREKKLDEATRWSEKAIAKNLDTYDGVTFKARLLAAQGRRGEAITAMEAGASKYNYNVEAWRVLSAMQSEEGRTNDAVSNMKKAVDLRPDDATSLLQYSATLQNAGRTDEALRMIRDASKLLQDNPAVRDEWLRLEGTLGDKETALAERSKDALRDPTNRAYKVQIAALNVDLRKFDEARKRIDEVRKSQDGPDIVQIDAAWYYDQANVPGAEKVFRDYAAKVKGEDDGPAKFTDTMMGLARFMAPRNQGRIAVKALEEARATQDPKTLPAERMLAELYLDQNESDKAIESLKKVLDSQKDAPDDGVRLRLAEALIGSRRFDEGEKELDKLGKEAREGVVAQMLRADAANARGDSAKASDILNRAVTSFPTSAGVFLKRAQLAIEHKGNATDTLADLDQALKLDPRMWQAHQLRAVVFERNNRREDMINAMKSLLQVNPNYDEMLGMAIRELVKMDRDDEAASLAESVARQRGGMGAFYASLGDLFDTLERPDRARAFYKLAFNNDNRSSHAVRYINAVLAVKPPNITEAEGVLSRVETRINKDPELLLGRAAIRKARGNMAEARKDASASMKLIPVDSVPAMQQWFNSAFSLLGGPETIGTLDAMSKDPSVNQDWLTFFRCRLQADQAATQEKGLEEMLKLSRSTKIAGLATLARNEHSGRLYLNGKFEQAEKAMRDIVAANPDDAETLNNLAYLLGKDLKKPQEALEFAKKAADLRPKSPETLDTYGMVLLQLGKLDESKDVLTRAISLPSGPSTQVTILMHIAEVQFNQGKKDEAKATLTRAKTLSQQSRSVTEAIQKAEMERLEKLIGA